MSRKYIFLYGAITILVAGLVLTIFFGYRVNTSLNRQAQYLQSEISALQNTVQKVNDVSQKALLSTEELNNRREVVQKSQDQLLTAAVSKAAPSVVSIVISKDVPQLEVTYENPFGNDPFFKDFGFQVPVYKQKGVERQKVGAGSGFIITGDGYIITNKHVVEDTAADYTVLLSNGSQKKATVVYRDTNKDLAIVKIEGSGYPALALGNSNTLKAGQTVIAIGNALGQYNNSVSVGIVSGLNRTITAGNNQGSEEQLQGVIQTDAAINPGNSGGPLLDLDGKAMGINVATVIGSNNISFAIPINTVKSILSQLK